MATRSNRRNRTNQVEAENTSINAEVEGTDETSEVTAEPTVDAEQVSDEPNVQTDEETDEVDTVDTDKVAEASTGANGNLPKGTGAPEGTVSVYAAASRVNGWLKERGAKKEDGSPKQLPPQMFYNYTTARIRKGQNPAMAVVEANGKHYIEDEVLAAWFETYYAKNVAAKNTGTATVEETETESTNADANA